MSTVTPVAEHIDPTLIHTDVIYRFKYVAGFMNFGADDIAAIKGTANELAPHVKSLVDAVYQKLFSYDITKQVFLQRGEGFQGKLANNLSDLDLNNDQIKFRKDFLTKYLVKLVTAEYNDNFIKYLDWVGAIHTDTITKKSKINVEYIHCNALFGFVADAVIATIRTFKYDHEREARVIAAFSKLLWIQNDLFARWYVKEGPQHLYQKKDFKSCVMRNKSTILGFVSGAAAAVGIMFAKSALQK